MALTRAPLPVEPTASYLDGSQAFVAQTPTAIVLRVVLRPGHRWSTHVKPLEGTDTCEVAHVGLVTAGRMRVTMDDGATAEFGPGDAYDIPPGHDAEVVGDEPCVCIGFRHRQTP